jgi:predicted permease
MKAGGRGLTASRERFGLRRTLVVAQMALSLVLLVGALLFVGTLRNLLTVDPGFTSDRVLAVSLDLGRAAYPKEQLLAVKKSIVDAIRALPDVQGASESGIVPLSGSGWNNRILIGGAVQKDYPNFNQVSPGYFKTLRTPLVAGRDFDERDDASAPRVVIVNEAFVKKFLARRDPLGATFQIEEPPGAPRPQYQVVGVVKDTKYQDMREDFGPIAYLAAGQDGNPDPYLQVVVRAAGPLSETRSALTRAVGQVHPAISLNVEAMTSQIQRGLLVEKLMATLTGLFGGLAGLIAAIGLYGVMSYVVARRRNEIGIRMALGADRSNVIRMVLRESGALLGLGVLAGALLSVAAARTASSLLFGLTPGDPLTFAQATVALAIVAALASYLPARRASRVDPCLALRDE